MDRVVEEVQHQRYGIRSQAFLHLEQWKWEWWIEMLQYSGGR